MKRPAGKDKGLNVIGKQRRARQGFCAGGWQSWPQQCGGRRGDEGS